MTRERFVEILQSTINDFSEADFGDLPEDMSEGDWFEQFLAFEESRRPD